MPIGRPNASALLRVLDRPLDQPLHRADRADRHQQPLPGEVGHDQFEALVLLAEQVLLWHLDVGEGQLAGVGGVPAELLELLRDLIARHLALEDQERDAVVAALLRRLAGADEEVGANAVGDEGLGAVDDVAAVDALGEGGDAGDVGAGAGLGDPERADLLAGDPGDQPTLFLLLGAEVEDRRHRDRGVGVEAGRDAAGATGPCELLDPDRVVQVGAALAAVLLGELEPEEAELGATPVELAREPARLLPLVDVWRYLLGDEAPHGLAQLLVLLAEGRKGGALSCVLDDGHS